MLLYLEMGRPMYFITTTADYEQDMREHAIKVLRRVVNLSALTDEE